MHSEGLNDKHRHIEGKTDCFRQECELFFLLSRRFRKGGLRDKQLNAHSSLLTNVSHSRHMRDWFWSDGVLRLVFTSDIVVVGVIIRSVERYDLEKIKPTESIPGLVICWFFRFYFRLRQAKCKWTYINHIFELRRNIWRHDKMIKKITRRETKSNLITNCTVHCTSQWPVTDSE